MSLDVWKLLQVKLYHWCAHMPAREKGSECCCETCAAYLAAVRV